MKKRSFSLILCAAMVMAFSVNAFAYTSSSPTTYKPWYGTTYNVDSSLTIRSSASTSGSALAYLPSGGAIQVIGKPNSSWYRVQYTTGGSTGYASASYLSCKTTYCAVSTTAGLTLRSGAGTSYSALGTIPYGTSIPYNSYSTVGGVKWFHVVWGMTSGWICSTYTNY